MKISSSSISRLLRWFYENGRHSLPWRQNRSLYRVWVSEIMLQQTQVKTVLDYYSRFLSAFPDVNALAEAEEETVLRQWEGLGYYRRARQLHAAAKVIVAREDSSFPETFAEVLALPGIGRYTAGAILSFAQDQRLPILEANTQRLFARLNALEVPTGSGSAQKILWKTAEDFISEETSHESPCAINTALMDLGSLLCTPQNPQCDRCPFQQECEALRQNRVSQIPVASVKTAYESRTEAAVLITRSVSGSSEPKEGIFSKSEKEEVLLLRYVKGEWWAGLWDFPRTQIFSDKPESEITDFVQKTTGLKIRLGAELTSFRHSVTRYRILLRTFQGELSQTSSPQVSSDSENAFFLRGRTPAGGEIRWVGLSELNAFPLCSTGRKIVEMLQKKSVSPTTKGKSAKR